MSITWQKDPNSKNNNKAEEEEEEEETRQFSFDYNVNLKIKTAVAGLRPFVKRYFFEFASDRDKELVADFVLSCFRQENITSNTRRAYIVAVATMARYFFKGEKKKDISAITSKDLAGYLNSMQRDENQDPDQSWIGNQRAMGLPLLKFFKWMAYPDLTPREKAHSSR
jgi:hypothetical protein